MSISDELRAGVAKAKKERDDKTALADAFNGASLKLIKQFIANVDSGAVVIDDVADLSRLMNIYLEINNVGNGEGGTGTLPSVTPKQKEVFEEENIVVSKVADDGEEEDYIDLEALSEMSTEDVAKMLMKREEQVNNDNEGAF